MKIASFANIVDIYFDIYFDILLLTRAVTETRV